MSKTSIAIAAGVAALALSQPVQNVAVAQGLTCNDIDFNRVILDRFPNADDYCLSVHEVDGKMYAEFEGEVVSNRAGVIRARFKHPDGSWGPTAEFRPDMSKPVKIQGRTYRLRDMERGQVLNVMVPEDDFSIHVADDDDISTAPVAVAPVMASTVSDSGSSYDTLPRTASPVMLYGLLGGLLVGLGFAIGMLRLSIRR